MIVSRVALFSFIVAPFPTTLREDGLVNMLLTDVAHNYGRTWDVSRRATIPLFDLGPPASSTRHFE